MNKTAAFCLERIFLTAVLLTALATFVQAQPERMNVLAWLEGNRVVLECATPQTHGARPVANAQVTVFDNVSNRELLQGRTSPAGRYAFQVPAVVREGHGLRVEVKAGAGQASDWVMSADELYDAAALTAGFERANMADQALAAGSAARADLSARTAPAQHAAAAPARQSRENTVAATPEHVRRIVAETLDSKLEPLHKRLATMENRGSDIVEIVGGIGWLIGLAGLWFYLRSRRKS